MAASDKARFYLEKSVPELKEYEKKKIFTKVSRVHLSRSHRQLNESPRMKSHRLLENDPSLSTN
jgi:hypothetical protein